MQKQAENIILSGIGLTRSVFINGEEIKPPEGSKFDWGYVGDSTSNLAYEILCQEYGSACANVTHKEFTQVVVACLPSGNFNAVINMQKWIDWHDNPSELKKHPFALMELNITENLKISKFLDLPNNDIKTANFKKGTIEYAELLKLEEYNMLFELNRYYESKTTTMDINNTTRKVWASLKKSTFENAYVYENGMGKLIEFEGHKIEEYDI